MATWTVCATFQLVLPRASRQSVILLPAVTSASSCPAGPAARVCVPAGSAGSCSQLAPRPAQNAAGPRPAGPVGSGADGPRGGPPAADQAASVPASGPEPTCSKAVVCFPEVLRASTPTPLRASAGGSDGPAACHRPPRRAKMPAMPGFAQSPASSGAPPGPNAAAVRRVSPHAFPAGAAPSAPMLDKPDQAAPSGVPTWAPPAVVSAMSLPSGAAASASGAFARPGSTGVACDQRAPPSLVAVVGEDVRS